ncbi:hypothetical protein BDF21DRAFT_478411 [Thamnidium elegans]|nr:hypothetical protein BDF21DRAFT_478411 [Thamnidium elegans]
MRAFSATLFIAVASLSVSAAKFDKRDVPYNPQMCIGDINTLSQQLVVIKTTVDAFEPSVGFEAAMEIHNEEQVLEHLLEQTYRGCCVNSPANIKEEEEAATIEAIGNYVSHAAAAISAMEIKKPDFDVTPPATEHFRGHIVDLTGMIKDLFSCIAFNTPKKSLPIIKEYNSTVADAFARAKAVYAED